MSSSMETTGVEFGEYCTYRIAINAFHQFRHLIALISEIFISEFLYLSYVNDHIEDMAFITSLAKFQSTD